jgi:putative membrane protein
MPDPTAIASLPLADAPGWWIVFPLGWLTLFFLIFFVFRRGFRGAGCGWGPGPRYGRAAGLEPEHPLEILGRRFAAGEIDAEEYRSRRAALEREGDA